jgi:hypothetical protein
MLFDDIAHSRTARLSEISQFRRSHPLEFWRRLREWRLAVDVEAARRRDRGQLTIKRTTVDRAKHKIVDLLHDESSSDRAWAAAAGPALVAGLDDVVEETAGLRWEQRSCDHLTGPSAVIWLACLKSGRRCGIDVLRRLFSPLRPSSYPPAQYSKIVLPPHRRMRVIDDGSLRLGG